MVLRKMGTPEKEESMRTKREAVRHLIAWEMKNGKTRVSSKAIANLTWLIKWEEDEVAQKRARGYTL